MPAFFLYLLKANIALTLFYLAYRFGLRRLTFYTLNRAFLLFGILFAAIYPSIDITAFFQQHRQLATRVIYYWPGLSSASQPEVFTIWNALTILFWAGVIIMSVRFIFQLISLWRFHKITTLSVIGKNKIWTTSKKINPFSFFQKIYLNPHLHTPPELRAILQHELVHVQQWHTLDVLAAEVNIIFYWFNPGAWLMKNAVKENLEFIADKKVLKTGADAIAYQYNLIHAAAPQAMALANNFNFSHLKNRIIMMNKKRSSRANLLKYFLLLPVVILVLVFTISKAQVNHKKTGNIISENIKQPLITQKTNNNSNEKYFKQHDKLSAVVMLDTVPSNNKKPKVIFTPPRVVKFTPPKIVKDTAVIIKENINEEPQKTKPEIIIDTANRNSVYIHVDVNHSQPLRLVKKITDTNSVKLISVVSIKPVNAVKGKTATTISGTKGTQSVMIAETYNGEKNKTINEPLAISVGNSVVTTVVTDTTGDSTMPHPLYIVDGEKVASIKNIKPGTIESINVLKGESATDAYGEKGKNGVIIITTKKGDKQKK